jgi:hypothetical protein
MRVVLKRKAVTDDEDDDLNDENGNERSMAMTPTANAFVFQDENMAPQRPRELRE